MYLADLVNVTALGIKTSIGNMTYTYIYFKLCICAQD